MTSNVLQKIRTLFEDESLFEKEQKLWKDVAEIETKLKTEGNTEKREKHLADINEFKNMIRDLYESDPGKLKYRLQELEKALIEADQENTEVKAMAKYYAYLINKNIETLQRTTADELRGLVSYDALDFDMLLEKIKPQEYSYEKNYLQALENWYKLLDTEFEILTSQPTNYLLTAQEILKLKSGNPADIAILTCAVMHKLGDFQARVTVAELEDFSTIHFTKTKHKHKILIFDFFNSGKFDDYFEVEKNIFEVYIPEIKKVRAIKYEFNRYMFELE